MLARPRHVVAPCPRSAAGTSNISSSDRRSSRPVQETVYETQQVTCVRDVCETVMQPQDRHHDADGRRAGRAARSPTRSSGPCYRTVMRRVPLHRPAAGARGRSGRTAAYTVCRPVRETHMETRSYTVCRPVRETYVEDVRLQRLHAGPRGLLQGVLLHGLPAGPARR